jgi:hypothetical protein
MTQPIQRNSENVGRFFRHHHRGVFREWAVQCLLRGRSVNSVAQRYNATHPTKNRVTARYVAQKVEWVAQVIREVDPDGLGLQSLLTRPYHLWSALKLWRAGHTMRDILTLPQLNLQHCVRGVGPKTITNIRRLAATASAA